jgi:heme A synthase
MSSLPDVRPAAAAPLRGPFRLTIATLVFATLTILKGAMTSSTGSGMAYTTYPLSDGSLMPESSYTTWAGFFEHFHRLSAMATGLGALAIASWLQFARLADARARLTAWIGGCLVLGQGLLGGVGVWLGKPRTDAVTTLVGNQPAPLAPAPELVTPVWTSVLHGTLAQLTFASFAWLAYQLTQRYRTTAPVTTVPPGAGRKLVVFGLTMLVLQTVLGAIARHSNSPHALWTHAGNALVVFLAATIATAFAMGRLAMVPGIVRICRTTVFLLIVQIALGFVALAIRNPDGKRQANVANLGVAFTISVHVLVGATLTMLMATLAAHVFRATRREPDPAQAVE